MTPERWQKIVTLLENARQMNSNECFLYLVKECEGDPDLLIEVKDFLVSRDNNHTYLDEPLFGKDFNLGVTNVINNSDKTAETLIFENTSIGRYRIIKKSDRAVWVWFMKRSRISRNVP